MSIGSESGHQSWFVRPRSERTVTGRSAGQPIDSPVFASMSLHPLQCDQTASVRTAGRPNGNELFSSVRTRKSIIADWGTRGPRRGVGRGGAAAPVERQAMAANGASHAARGYGGSGLEGND